MAKEKTKEDEMLEKMSIDDIKEAIEILTKKARKLIEAANAQNMYLSDRNQRFSKDYDMMLFEQHKKRKDANNFLKHVKKLQRRLCELEGRPIPEDIVEVGGASQFTKLTGDGKDGSFVTPDSDSYKEQDK